MSYIGLFNETDVSADNIVVTDFVCDTLAVNTSLTSNGTTSINDTTLTGVLNGLLTAVSNGSDITYTYNASTKTFTIQLNNNSINLSKISTTAYTPLNTVSTLVSRDVHGSFSATDITLSGYLTTQKLYVYGTSEIYNDLNFHEGHTINLIPSGGLDCPLICWYTDQSTESINISPLNSTINFFNEFGFNKISLTGSSGQIICNDINIATGQSYKINNVALKTDNIPAGTNKYLNSLSATLPLVYTPATNIVSLSPTGNISVATITTTGTGTFQNGSSAQGAPYSAIFGKASSTQSGQIAIIDGTSNNQYVQLYCRSNIFGVQGNITSIALQKNTNITGTLNVSNTLTCSNGVWSTDYPSLVLGTSGTVNQGVLQMWNNATTSFLIEASSGSALEIYQKVSATSTILHALNDTTANYYTDMNLSTGHMYKINNVNVNTDDIQENTVSPINIYYTQGRFDNAFGIKSTTNLQEGTSLYYTQGRFDTAFGNKSTTNLTEGTSLYYTDLRARTAIVPSNTSEITHTYSTLNGILTASLNANSVNPSKIAVGFPDQFIVTNHGSTASTWVSMTGHGSLVSGALTITDGAITLAKLSNIYYTQSYPSTLVYRDQSGGASFGFLTVDNTLSCNGLRALYGLSDIYNPNSSNSSFRAGTDAVSDGSIRLCSASGLTNPTIIQHFSGSLYIDNCKTTGSTINIGTLVPNQVVCMPTVDIQNINIHSPPLYDMLRFTNMNRTVKTNLSHTDSVPTTWVVVSHTATLTPLQTSITMRGNYAIRIIVNMPINNWGTTASNHLISILRSAGTPFVYGQTSALPLVGSNYGLSMTLSGVQYGGASFTYIDDFMLYAGTTYYYCILAKSVTTATVGEVLGNNSYVDITVEAIY